MTIFRSLFFTVPVLPILIGCTTTQQSSTGIPFDAPSLPSVPLTEVKLPGHLTLSEFDRVTAQIEQYRSEGRKVAPAPYRANLPLPRFPKPRHNATITVWMIINEKGRVDRMRVTGNDADFLAPSLRTDLSRWQFPPMLVDGKPHSSTKKVPMRFTVETHAERKSGEHASRSMELKRVHTLDTMPSFEHP